MSGCSARPAASEASASIVTAGSVCRICFDGSSVTIRPCLCAQPVHKVCLQRWVHQKASHGLDFLACEVCRSAYALTASRLKPRVDWTLPSPLSGDFEDRLDFHLLPVWVAFLVRILYIAVIQGAPALRQQVALTLGDGFLARAWWLCFAVNSVYYGSVTVLISNKWFTENSIYEFTEHSRWLAEQHSPSVAAG